MNAPKGVSSGMPELPEQKNDLQIREVYMERVFNLGNSETFRIGFHATVGPNDTPDAIVIALDNYILKCRNQAKKA